MTNYADMDTNEAGGHSSASFRLLTAVLIRGEENKYIIAPGVRR